jgi:hypothetical protein
MPSPGSLILQHWKMKKLTDVKIEALAAFLKTLTDKRYESITPDSHELYN